MKLTPVLNLANILGATFSLIFFLKILQRQTVIRDKLSKTILYNKAARKMLVKLTTKCNFLRLQNVLCSHFNEYY